MNEWSGLDGQRCVGRQHATKKKWSDIWSMNASLIFISEINRHIPIPPMITGTSNDIAAQFVISHFIIIVIISEWMNDVIGWLINEWIIIMMMKKSVLHYVADDRYGMFEDNEEAQFEMLFSLISEYHVNEEITTDDKHGSHVRYLLLFLLIIIIAIIMIHIYHSSLSSFIMSSIDWSS